MDGVLVQQTIDCKRPRVAILSMNGICDFWEYFRNKDLTQTMDIDDLTRRHHIEPEYLKKLGFAFYSFCSAESNATWCCDRLAPGFAQTWFRKDWAQVKKLATKLKHEAGTSIKLRDDADYKRNLKELVSYADRLYVLADNDRNKLFHALPVGDEGKTVLHNSGTTFTEQTLEQFINEALECRSYFNKAFHGYLADYFGNP